MSRELLIGLCGLLFVLALSGGEVVRRVRKVSRRAKREAEQTFVALTGDACRKGATGGGLAGDAPRALCAAFGSAPSPSPVPSPMLDRIRRERAQEHLATAVARGRARRAKFNDWRERIDELEKARDEFGMLPAGYGTASQPRR